MRRDGWRVGEIGLQRCFSLFWFRCSTLARHHSLACYALDPAKLAVLDREFGRRTWPRWHELIWFRISLPLATYGRGLKALFEVASFFACL